MDDVRWTTVIIGREDWPIDGNDTLIAMAPMVDGELASIDQLMWWASRAGERAARDLGTRLHHGDFIATTSIETVQEFGIMPDHVDCEGCIEGVEVTCAHLELHPDQPVIVGQLWWSPNPP